MKDPTVSVIMITYGHEKYIAQAMEGVLMQQGDVAMELIIANDCSPDGTDAEVRKFIDTHPKGNLIKYTRHEKNKGMMPNFNFAVQQARGKYIALCEGDDYWTDPLKLKSQVDILENDPDYGLVCTDFSIYHEQTGVLEESMFKNHPQRFPVYAGFKEFLLAGGFMAPCTWLCRKELVPANMDNHIDGSFVWLLEVYLNSKVYILPQTTAVYRMLTESASHSASLEKRYNRSTELLALKLQYAETHNLPEEFKLKVKQRHYHRLLPIMVALNKKEDIKEAKKLLPKGKKNFRNKCLFAWSELPLGSKMLYKLFWLKENVAKNNINPNPLPRSRNKFGTGSKGRWFDDKYLMKRSCPGN